MRDWDFTISHFEEAAGMLLSMVDSLRKLSHKDNTVTDDTYHELRLEAQYLHYDVLDRVEKIEQMLKEV